jgi:hypothetical protein
MTLQKVYTPNSAINLSVKVSEFTSFSPLTNGSGASTVIDIAVKLTTLQREIREISSLEMPSDILKTAVLYRALREVNPEYNGPLVSLELAGILPWEVVLGRCTDIERRLLKPQKEAKGQAQAMKATTNSSNGNKRFGGKCYNCGSLGHRARDCRVKRKGSGDGKAETRESEGSRASTGPLPVPGVKKSVPAAEHHAKQATEYCWMAQGSTDSLKWMVDSGCSRHMTFHRAAFDTYTPLRKTIKISTASGTILEGVAKGTVSLSILLNSQIKTVKISGVVHVPGLSGSLISVLQL